ncbi:MAG: hypothetical protein LZF86_190582 [Nitrospira sp.]|nr:MAG: hypothetical protein LZF86_190582 [Nitrospira sp.]
MGLQPQSVGRCGLFARGVELALNATAVMMSNMKRIIADTPFVGSTEQYMSQTDIYR